MGKWLTNTPLKTYHDGSRTDPLYTRQSDFTDILEHSLSSIRSPGQERPAWFSCSSIKPVQVQALSRPHSTNDFFCRKLEKGLIYSLIDIGCTTNLLSKQVCNKLFSPAGIGEKTVTATSLWLARPGCLFMGLYGCRYGSEL